MLARVVFGSLLHSEMVLAIRRYERAQVEFSAAISLPGDNPDRPRRIKQAAEMEALARNELWRTQQRLDSFNLSGLFPQTPRNGPELVRPGSAP
jgi:hypothetical protein